MATLSTGDLIWQSFEQSSNNRGFRKLFIMGIVCNVQTGLDMAVDIAPKQKHIYFVNHGRRN